MPLSGELHDGAALAVCYQPLGTQKQVSSIVIAGYTGLSSMLAAEEAAYKLPEFDPEKTPGDPWYTVMRCSYHKRRDYPRSTEITRIVEPGSVKWTPPCTCKTTE